MLCFILRQAARFGYHALHTGRGGKQRCSATPELERELDHQSVDCQPAIESMDRCTAMVATSSTTLVGPANASCSNEDRKQTEATSKADFEAEAQKCRPVFLGK